MTKQNYYGFEQLKTKRQMAQILSFCEKNEEIKNELNDSLLVWESEDGAPMVYDTHLQKWFRVEHDLYFDRMYVVPKKYLHELEATNLYVYLTSPFNSLVYSEVLYQMLGFAEKAGVEIEWQKAFS